MDQKLLLIDNNTADIEKINSILSAEFPNINIYSTSNQNDILKEVEIISPDIIIFDIDCPENNIDQNLKLLLDILRIKQLPIIVLSSTSDYNKIFKAGAINFIQKPYSEITLISNLKTATNLINILKSISIKEQEIEEKNQKIHFQIENELKQREIIISKNKEIMADIRYASRIQHAILPSIEFINKNMHEYFILHQPKSHVSGDFYWVSCLENKRIIAVGDCTGHGLSGALMHMVGSVYLNGIISNGNFETASDILEQLRDHIMKSLNQTGETGETQDGLDISLCIIDCEDKKMQFAGANNPVYVIKNKELTEIKGDRMPVGIHINFDKPFTNHIIDLESNDQIYLFSDGYADQFGGPRGKKFRYKQFKELLVNISHEPMNIQKEILNNVHDKWRGSLEQIDDILVFGIKIK
jgi:serine phosphatase RsbU (regulator of sigma subunit)